MRKSTAWSGNRSGCSAIRRSTSNAVSILRRISVSVVSFLLEPRFHQRTVPLPLAREILAEYICVRRRSVNRHPLGRTGPPGHYHFDDRARRVILPADVTPYRGGTSWHIWYWPCSPSPSFRRSERVWPCIRPATSWQAPHRPAAWRAVRTITKRTIRPAKGMRRATTTRRSGPTRPPTTHSRPDKGESRRTTKTTTLRNLSFVVLVLGLLLVFGGVSLFVAANGPRDRAYTFSLPSQANRYQRIQVSILTAGSIDVTYQSDNVITVWVMTEAQHTQFLPTGQAQGLGQDTGISGGFATALPSGGTYFVEIGHGSGYETTAETGVVRLSLSGLDPTLSVGGLGCVVGGTILAVVGFLYRGVAKKREATMSPFYGPGGVGAAGYPGTQYP